MKVDDALIERVAILARLQLSDEEKRQFKKDFSEVLDAFGVLDEIEIPSDDPKTIQPVPFGSINEPVTMREDEPGDCLTQQQALAYTKDSEDGFFIGPKVTK